MRHRLTTKNDFTRIFQMVALLGWFAGVFIPEADGGGARNPRRDKGLQAKGTTERNLHANYFGNRRITQDSWFQATTQTGVFSMQKQDETNRPANVDSDGRRKIKFPKARRWKDPLGRWHSEKEESVAEEKKEEDVAVRD